MPIGKETTTIKTSDRSPIQRVNASLLATHIPDRGIVGQGPTKIQLGPALDPFPVLNVQGLIEAIELLQPLDDFLVLATTGRGYLGLECSKEIARWQLDDDEGDDRDEKEGRIMAKRRLEI